MNSYNSRLVSCIAGYAINIDGKATVIGINDAVFLLDWLKQCKFEIKDLKDKPD